MNTNYYRAASDMAVSSTNEYGGSAAGHNSPGDYEIPINDFEDDMKHNRTLASSSQSIKLVSSGKTSRGMDEMNKLTNDRINKKHQTDYNRKDSFEERLHESMNSMASSNQSRSGLRDSCNTLNSVEEEDYQGGEQQSQSLRRKKSSKHRHKDGKHRKSHRRERHTDGVEEGDDHKHRSSRRSSNNEDNDKGHKSSSRRKRRDQGEKERLKASIREELRSSANQQSSSTAAATAALEEESELEKRRRKQRE